MEWYTHNSVEKHFSLGRKVEKFNTLLFQWCCFTLRFTVYLSILIDKSCHVFESNPKFFIDLPMQRKVKLELMQKIEGVELIFFSKQEMITLIKLSSMDFFWTH